MLAETNVGEERVIVGEAELVEADFVSAGKLVLGGKRAWLLAGATGVFTLVVMSRTFGDQPLASRLIVVLPSVFLVTLLAYFQRSGKNAWAKQALADLGGPTRFRLDDFGFSTQAPKREHRLAWSGLARFLETPQAFLVYTTPRTLLVVPKRAFAAGDVEAVRGLLATRIVTKRAASFGSGSGSVRTLVLWVALIIAFLAIWQLLSRDDSSSQPHDSDAPQTEHSDQK